MNNEVYMFVSVESAGLLVLQGGLYLFARLTFTQFHKEKVSL